MTFHEFGRIVDSIKYKPGVTFNYWERFDIQDEFIEFQIQMIVPDATKEHHPPVSVVRMQRFDPRDMHQLTRESLRMLIYEEVKKIEAHEINEWLYIDGERWKDPH